MSNIITAVFSGSSRFCTTRSVFQIDRGDVLRFVGLDLPEYYEVHFSNSKNALATRVLASGDSVVIPWEFMRHGLKEVFAWVYITPDAETGYTPFQVTIPLNLRSDVSDVEPTPEQEDIIGQAIAALNDGVERAEDAAGDAEEAARHYPRIVDGYWQVWDVDAQTWSDTGVKAVGEDGLPGRDGAPGRDGRDGVDGQDGAPGVTYTPTVSADGEISWSNDGGLPNPQPRNIMGPAGQDGQDGAPGPNQVTTNTATTITGLLKGNGSTVSAATPGTDYATPAQVNAKYTKPASGIPKSDMAQDVQTSLGKADTAIQPADYAPDSKTASMTQPVGKDASGKLWTEPGGGGVTDVQVNGTTPTITALPGVRYVCGEVSTLDITLPASGIVDVTFESGSVPTVLTLTPPTGVTLKWADGFDPDNLAANTSYEIRVTDGEFGSATIYGAQPETGFELIEEIVIADNTREIRRSYSEGYRDIILTTSFLSSSLTSWMHFALITTSGNTGQLFNTNKKYTLIKASIDAGHPAVITAQMKEINYLEVTYNPADYNFMLSNGYPIKGFQWGADGADFPSGETIYVYGIKA